MFLFVFLNCFLRVIYWTLNLLWDKDLFRNLMKTTGPIPREKICIALKQLYTILASWFTVESIGID